MEFNIQKFFLVLTYSRVIVCNLFSHEYSPDILCKVTDLQNVDLKNLILL